MKKNYLESLCTDTHSASLAKISSSQFSGMLIKIGSNVNCVVRPNIFTKVFMQILHDMSKYFKVCGMHNTTAIPRLNWLVDCFSLSLVLSFSWLRKGYYVDWLWLHWLLMMMTLFDIIFILRRLPEGHIFLKREQSHMFLRLDFQCASMPIILNDMKVCNK